MYPKTHKLEDDSFLNLVVDVLRFYSNLSSYWCIVTIEEIYNLKCTKRTIKIIDDFWLNYNVYRNRIKYEMETYLLSFYYCVYFYIIVHKHIPVVNITSTYFMTSAVTS